ncbi:MAG: substrate-binding domain-containing protein [Planctomycetota bacterium]
MLLYLIALATLTACERTGSGVRPAVSGSLIAVIGVSENDPHWPGIAGGARRYFTGVPIFRGACVAPADGSPDKLQAVVAGVLEQRPSAVCIQIADPNAAAPAVEPFLSRQIPVVTIGTPYADSRIIAHLGINLLDAAEQLARQLDQVAAGSRTYLLLHESGRDEVATARYERFRMAAQAHSTLRLLEEENAFADQRGPVALIELMLAEYPHAGLLITLAPDVWLTPDAGWKSELRRRNADFRFITFSAAPVLWRKLGTPEQRGEAAALVGVLDGDLGHRAVECAVSLLMGAPTPNRERLLLCEVVTPESLPDFAQRYAAAAGGLDITRYLPTAAPRGPAGPGASAPAGVAASRPQRPASTTRATR